jgi:protein transport protein SEC31
MKVKEIDATANMAWSPGRRKAHFYHLLFTSYLLRVWDISGPAVPIMIAAGTSAQQLDASFNTSSSLDIYELDLTDSNNEMGKVCSFGVDNRYHKLVWGDAGMANGDRYVST